MSPEARTVIEWLAEGPGRRLSGTSLQGSFRGIEVSGEMGLAAISANTVAELSLDRLIGSDGPARWRPTAAGYLEGSKMPRGKHAPPDHRRCIFEKPSGDRCRAWTMRGQELCYYHLQTREEEKDPGPAPPSADACRRHGIRRCPSCEELAERDALAGRRLRTKLEQIRKERVPW